MKNLGYYNGAIGLLEEMQISMLDRACYFGDGIYEAASTRNHKVYELEAHIERFFTSAALLLIDVPFTRTFLHEKICELVSMVDDDQLLVYWQISRGIAIRGHAFPEAPYTPSLMITITPNEVHDVSVPVSVITMNDTRFLHCNIKTLNLIPNVMAAQKAKEAECVEAIFHREGRVTEGSHSNVHILKDGTLYTAPADNLILNGITRRKLLKACRVLNIPFKEEPYTLRQLMEADEIIITSTGALAARVEKIDNIAVGGRASEMMESLQTYIMNDFWTATEK